MRVCNTFLANVYIKSKENYLNGKEVGAVDINVEKLLNLNADMERFMHLDDRLGQMIEEVCNDELFEADLTFVAAATNAPDYEIFINRINDRHRRS